MNLQLDELSINSDMRKSVISFLLVCFICTASYGQDAFKYHRSSLYSILLKHENKPYAKEIETAFKAIPTPEKFYEHNLSHQVFKAAVLQDDDSDVDGQKQYIDELMVKNAIGRRLVSKWYNRSKQGTFNCDLLISRGYYDASAFDIALADRTIVGRSNILRDAGRELISNTYVVVHDIQYYDRRETGKKLSNIVTGIGSTVAGLTIVGIPAMAAATRSTESIAGFKVCVTSYLYRLDWNDEAEGLFYKTYYTTTEDLTRKDSFNKDKSNFKLTYVGKQKVYSGITTMRGVNRQEEFFIKVCTRAMDEAIAKLQKDHVEFRVRTPLISTEPLIASIGVKEGMTTNSRYEVLEVSEEDGMTKYKRVGVIKPIKGKIWDNRYLAEAEEDNASSLLKHTEFETISGSGFYPGMLIREIYK